MVNSSVKVNVPGLSSFDKSFKNILTSKVGTITPIVSQLLIPGSRGRVKVSISAALPPLASDTFMRCNLKVESFLVPLRLLYGGFESWLTGSEILNYSSGTYTRANLPRLKEPAGTSHPYFAPGTLFDYLGYCVDSSQTTNSDTYFNVLKPLAYHRVYHDWYRSARIQKPLFMPFNSGDASAVHDISAVPYWSDSTLYDFAPTSTFHDGVALWQLRQRNWGDDYFTVATTSPQFGSAQSISTSGGSFTISSLRASNSLQQWSERSNLASPRLQDYVKAHYGASLNSGVAQRSILLGSASYPVYSKGVESNSTVTATNNPFTSVGARYGNAFASGTDFVCDFEANEPAYLMIMATLVPEANYASGVQKDCLLFAHSGSQVDLPDPLLENVGNEPIFDSELTGAMPGNPSGTVFGYVPRNTWFKQNRNQVHGLLRDGQSLSSFVAQRSFPSNTPVSISSNFLQIPTTALDNVTAVTAALSSYGVWIDSFIDLKVSEPLVESAMPSLQDPAYEHGHGVSINTNGSYL